MGSRGKTAIPDKTKRTEEFNRLYLEYESVVTKAILRMTGDVDAVEDIRQSTFMALYRKLETVVASGNVGGWLIKAAEKEVKHYQRKWSRKLQYEVGLEECKEVAVPPKETRETFLNLLPDWVDNRDRKILLWYYYDGYSLAAIAPKVGLTHKGLRVHVSRLFVKLRNSGIDWHF